MALWNLWNKDAKKKKQQANYIHGNVTTKLDILGGLGAKN